MPYIRTTMIKSDAPFKDGLKQFKAGDGPKILKAAGAQWIHMVQTGENSGMLVTCYDNKTKANKAWKASAGARAEAMADSGTIFWPIEGPSKWSI
jgi:hypothetical protein